MCGSPETEDSFLGETGGGGGPEDAWGCGLEMLVAELGANGLREPAGEFLAVKP